MKKNLKHLPTLVVILFCNIIFAAPNPPPPAAPPPTGFPLDSSLPVLIIIAILYFAIDYKRRHKDSQFED